MKTAAKIINEIDKAYIGTSFSNNFKQIQCMEAYADQFKPKWFKTSERLPERKPNTNYSQVPCLVKFRGEVTILVFNHEHECWDQEDGDDYQCDISEVSEWTPLPE